MKYDAACSVPAPESCAELVPSSLDVLLLESLLPSSPTVPLFALTPSEEALSPSSPLAFERNTVSIHIVCCCESTPKMFNESRAVTLAAEPRSMALVSSPGIPRLIWLMFAGKPLAGHRSGIETDKHGSMMVWYSSSPSASSATPRVTFPDIVVKFLASNEKVALEGVKDALKVEAFVGCEPWQACTWPE
jgi:hypothetical protein